MYTVSSHPPRSSQTTEQNQANKLQNTLRFVQERRALYAEPICITLMNAADIESGS